MNRGINVRRLGKLQEDIQEGLARAGKQIRSMKRVVAGGIRRQLEVRDDEKSIVEIPEKEARYCPVCGTVRHRMTMTISLKKNDPITTEVRKL